jgi:hypothetical protein
MIVQALWKQDVFKLIIVGVLLPPYHKKKLIGKRKDV